MSCLEQKLMVSLFKNRYFMARLQVVLKSRGYNGEGLSVWEGRTINRFAVEDMRTRGLLIDMMSEIQFAVEPHRSTLY